MLLSRLRIRGSFTDVYDACVYSWSLGKSDVEWYHSIGQPLHTILRLINQMVVSAWFEYCTCKLLLS